MTVEISKIKQAKFYIEADLEWLNRQINDERTKGFQEWVDKLNFGVPKNLAADIEAYQVEMKPYFDGLIALRDKLKSELDGIEQAIDTTKIETTEEVKKYLPEEEAISK